MAHNYRLQVTAGPAYDTSTHRIVPVNGSETMTIESEHMTIALAVRIQDYTGLPKDSPKTSPYFSHPLHTADQYSIALTFLPHTSISGDALVFGNDFDNPVRDRLPPGTGTAFRIVKWMIDPGLDGDMYSDKPYLYGPALSSWNILRFGEKIPETDKQGKEGWKLPQTLHEDVIVEGGDGSGEELRASLSVPTDSAARKKYFLDEYRRKDFTFEAGRLYQSDFGNPYLCFNDFSLKLPGFHLDVLKYMDDKAHDLRYTLKNRENGEVYLCVVFTLLWDEVVNKEQGDAKGTEEDKNEKVNKVADVGENVAVMKDPEPNEDDLD